MSKKFLLEYPYSQDWEYGFIVINNEGRRNVLLNKPKKEGGKNSTVSYARYLYAVHLGRYLTSTENVDHINGNKLDDFLENLQLVTKKENNLKYVIESNSSRLMAELKCPNCSKTFIKPYNQTHYAKKGFSTSCSRKCSGEAQAKYTKDQLKELGEQQILRKYRREHNFEKSINPALKVESFCTKCDLPERSCICKRLLNNFCKECNAKLKWKGTTGLCSTCSNKAPKYSVRKVERPSRVELIRMLETKISWREIGRRHNVSDNAVRKWAKSYGII